MGHGDDSDPSSQRLTEMISLTPLKNFHGQAESSELVFGDMSLPSPQTAGFLIKSKIFFCFYQHLPLSIDFQVLPESGNRNSLQRLWCLWRCLFSLVHSITRAALQKCSGSRVLLCSRPFRNISLLLGTC